MPTIEEFDAYLLQLGNHDWTFEYSDDITVWRHGKDAQYNLIARAGKKVVLMAAYNAYGIYTFADNNTSWPDRLIKRSNTIQALRQQILEAKVVALLNTP